MTQTADSFGTTEQSAADPATSEPMPEMGMGINEVEDTPAVDSESQGEQPEERAGSNGTTDKSVGGSAEAEPSEQELKAGYLRQQDYTRKTQDLADQRRQFEQAQQQFNEQQRAFAEQQQRLTELNERLAQSPALAPQDPIDQMIAQVMQQSGATPEQQQEAAAGLRLVDRLYAEKMQPLQAEIESLKTQLQSFGQQAMTAAERQAEQDKARINSEFAAADEALGAEMVNTALDFVKRNYGIKGPDGETLSITDLVARYHNRLAEDRSNAQQDARQQRRQAKQSVTVPASQSGPTDGGGFLSKEEAMAQIRSTM